MDKFGMSFGGGPNKKELLDTIESQKKQLIQYQTRFKDVVRAYKSLLKEKEALEASLKVLTLSQELDLGQRSDDGSPGGSGSPHVTPDFPDDHCSMHSEDSLDTAASADTATSITSGGTRGEQAEEENGGSLVEVGTTSIGGPSLVQRPEADASGSESGVSSSSSEQQQQTLSHTTTVEADRRVHQLKTQLTTLTSSLATVSQEKSRMEANFQADKRKIKQELDELQGRLEEARRQHEVEVQALQDQLAESKARVITQQHEREQEQGDHAHMLRELQKLLQEERGLRQDAELRLEDAKETLLETTQAADRGLDIEARLKVVTSEREEMRKKFEAAQVEKSRPDPRVEELQKEVAELKSHFHHQLQLEIRKASRAEDQVRELAHAEEGRVASLEERVSQLSELLGACEKARQRDQQTAQRLREHILQLDTENKTLVIAASSRGSTDLNMDEANLDVNVLKEKMEKVKRLLLLASQRSPDPTLEIEKLAEIERTSGTESDGEKASVLYYQQELRQLKDEFERYKVRAQVVLKNKNAKDGSQAKELEDARDQLAELKEKYINLRIQSDEAESRHKGELEKHHKDQIEWQQSHRQEMEKIEARHRENLQSLEGELHKQRDRTMALLAEKDQELERLRATTALGFGLARARGRSSSDEGDMVANYRVIAEVGRSNSDEATVDDPAQEESDIIAHALRLAGPNEPTLLLYAEQLARREVEISSLRRQKHCLEEDLHQLQGKLIDHGERHEEEMTELRIQLDKCLRDQGREGSNLEYLKNVIYKFLTLQDPRGRQQTLTAILTILHFSPQEKQVVVKLQGQSWWQAGMR